jgi:hypothetical protein
MLVENKRGNYFFLNGIAPYSAGVVAGTMRDSVAGANGTVGVYAGAPQVYFTVEESSIVANLNFGG